ncbi:MAG TPA: FAD-binding oxidoreductase [Membranihabitans sp.]|nr:FAD-binding oxidoreductase [Membranihabitans sp.]
MSSPLSTQVDAIIVGGGLAGIHLALAMERSGMQAVVVDRPTPQSSSRVAAGIINPITGRRFALSWLYSELHPVFTEVYSYWEDRWKVKFFQPRNIYRSVPANKLVNDLDVKLSEPEFSRYCRPMHREEIDRVSEILKFNEPGYVMHGYQLNTVLFLETAIRHLKSRKRYVRGYFSELDSQLSVNEFHFGNFHSETLVWANGAWIVQHQDFDWVGMNPNKGEVLKVRLPDQDENDIVKQSALYVPLSNQQWWVGTYDTWEWGHSPSTEGKAYLLDRSKAFKHSVIVEDHVASVRPAVQDRRPVIGAHPRNDQIYIFNGFGSKGTSLIPFFAKMMAGHLKQGDNIMREVDVRRYWSTS